MQESVFKRELNKYRVIRRDDHHKVRWKKMKESAVDVSGNAPSKASVKKNNKKLAAVPTVNLDTSFWKDIRESAASVMSANECTRFMAAMQQQFPTAVEKVNFDDIEAGLSMPVN